MRVKFIYPLLIALILSGLMLYYTESIPAVGEWYSFDQSLRLQTQAFMRGELAIQPVPYGHRHDWAWGNGMQQVWGLGVPIIQLPFHLLGKSFNSFGFPDRIIFLIFFSFVAAIFWLSLDSAIIQGMDGKERFQRRIQNIPIILFAFLNPALIIMMRAKYGPYEEVISYAYLWSLMLFALLYLFLNKKGGHLYLLICLLAGFSLNIRPTIGAYGGMTFLIASYLAWRGKVRFSWVGLPVFLSGMLFFFAMNYLRFGSPFEPGYRLSLTNSAFSDYVVRFDNTLNWVPFYSACLELLSALFFLDLHAFHVLNKGLLWRINVPRFREINFKPFDSFEFIMLIVSWSLLLVFWMRRKNWISAFAGRDKVVPLGILWSFFSFIMLFTFYSICPGLISRYLVDFGPSIIIGISMLYLYLNDSIRQRLLGRSSFLSCMALSGVFTVWLLFLLLTAEIVPLYPWLSKVELTNVTEINIAREKLAAMRRISGPPLPSGYSCGDLETKYDIPYNNSGWKASGNCMVELASTHFLDNPKCIDLELEPIDFAPESVKREYSDDEIEVKIGIEPMRRVSNISIGQEKVITFCSNDKNLQVGGSYSGIKMISIKWLNWRKHIGSGPIPLRLISIRKSR